MPSHNETKIHVSTNLHVCIENLDEGGERKRKNICAALKNEPDFNLKTFSKKRKGDEASYSVLGLSPGTMFLTLVHKSHAPPLAMA